VYDEKKREVLIHVIPSFSFYISPNINDLLKRFNPASLETMLQGIDLSTEKEYWKKRIGPKSAGKLKHIYTSNVDPRIFDYNKALERIMKYYQEKSKEKKRPEIYEYAEKKMKNNRAIIVSRIYRKGEEKPLHYLANMVHITPSTESLGDVLSELLSPEIASKVLDAIRDSIRPSKHEQYYELTQWAIKQILKAIENIPIMGVVKC